MHGLGARLLVGSVLCILTTSWAAQADPCTASQRAALAKAGYKKAEIEAMCVDGGGPPPSQPSPSAPLAPPNPPETAASRLETNFVPMVVVDPLIRDKIFSAIGPVPHSNLTAFTLRAYPLAESGVSLTTYAIASKDDVLILKAIAKTDNSLGKYCVDSQGATIVGLIPISSYCANTDSVTSITAITRISGNLFPVRTGNHFAIEYSTKIYSYNSIELSVESVDTAKNIAVILTVHKFGAPANIMSIYTKTYYSTVVNYPIRTITTTDNQYASLSYTEVIGVNITGDSQIKQLAFDGPQLTRVLSESLNDPMIRSAVDNEKSRPKVTMAEALAPPTEMSSDVIQSRLSQGANLISPRFSAVVDDLNRIPRTSP